MMRHTSLRSITAYTVAIFAAAALAGCASEPPPTAQLESARTAIQAAERSGAAERAPVELNTAREKLNRAELAVERSQNQQALWLAEEAQVDAEVAGTRAQAAAAQNAIEEIRQGTSALGAELRRPEPAR